MICRNAVVVNRQLTEDISALLQGNIVNSLSIDESVFKLISG